jgi:hypothetical protein
MQGISAGWSDTYTAELPGQEITVSPLEDGEYLLRLTVDPAERLYEADEENNSLTMRIRLEGIQAELLDDGL